MGLEELIKVRYKEEGREEGKEAVDLLVIKNMTKRGFSNSDICSILEIHPDQFAELQAKIVQ